MDANAKSVEGNAYDTDFRDPSVYAEYEKKWSSLPSGEEAWLQRAQDVADVLAVDAVTREKENKSPRAEVALLKYAGLLKILGPKKYGGGGQPWSVGLKAVRKLAEADGSIGMLLGYHLMWSVAAGVDGDEEQAERMQKLIVENNYYVAGAVNPRDADLKISRQGGKLVFNGFKHFCTGGVISDLIALEGVYDDTEHRIYAFVKTNQAGVIFSHNWNNMGLRLSESGSVKIENVAVEWSDALGWDAEKKAPRPEISKIPYSTVLLPAIQLVFSNFYLGIALGAQAFAAKYTLKNTRAWPCGGDNKERATDEFYILSTYGNFHAHLRAAVALADLAGDELSSIWDRYTGDLVTRAKLTARQRGELAELVASTKVVTTDTGLRVTAGVFEVTGAKSTSAKVGLDRFWRDIRTHTLHDPVAYKNRELGRFELLDEVPEPTWYT